MPLQAVKRNSLIAVGIVIFISLLAWLAQPETGVYRWYSILPPVIAVAFAVATRRLLPSLVAGAFVGSMLITVPAEPGSPAAWIGGLSTFFTHIRQVITDPFNLWVLSFIILMLSMITVVIRSGGLLAMVNGLSRFAKGPRSTQFVSALMGFIVFIDDYANVMVVGTAMRPASDSRKISREKLAFIVDATSAPVAGLAVISTWIGYEIGLFADISESLSFNRDGYSMFLDAIGYRFYCIFMIGFIFLNIWSRREFGSMLAAERRARRGLPAAEDAIPPGKLDDSVRTDPAARLTMRAALLPFGVLIVLIFLSLWVDGGGIALLTERPFSILNPGDWREVISNSENNVRALNVAGLLALLAAVWSAMYDADLSLKTVSRAAGIGVRAALYPACILILAWTLGEVSGEIQTGEFLVAVAGDAISPLMYPAIVFILSAAAALAIGSSWGTMAIFIPIAAQVAFQLDGGVYGLVTIMSLAAVLDGAIFGDHCSPISDTTIMSSIASSCDHIHHVRTQFPYALLVAVLAVMFGYLPASLGAPLWISFLAALAGFWIFLHIFGKNVS